MHIQHTLGAHVPGFSAVPNMRAHARAHTIHARIYRTRTYNTLLARAHTHICIHLHIHTHTHTHTHPMDARMMVMMMFILMMFYFALTWH